jgi:GAF domain-containing protein
VPKTPTTVDVLEHEIAHEERIVGIPTDEPLTHAAIVKRHVQIGVLLGLLSLAMVATVVSSMGALRLFFCVLALAFGVYAWVEGKHLEKLARLQRDETSIHLTVADTLLRSGILCADRELLDLRTAVERAAGRLVADLVNVVPAECAGLRLVGPMGETPLAAVCDLGTAGLWLDPSAAHDALARREPVRRGARDGRTVIAVPMEHQGDVVGVLEVLSVSTDRYSLVDELLVSAFARGAVSALLGAVSAGHAS